MESPALLVGVVGRGKDWLVQSSREFVGLAAPFHAQVQARIPGRGCGLQVGCGFWGRCGYEGSGLGL